MAYDMDMLYMCRLSYRWRLITCLPLRNKYIYQNLVKNPCSYIFQCENYQQFLIKMIACSGRMFWNLVQNGFGNQWLSVTNSFYFIFPRRLRNQWLSVTNSFYFIFPRRLRNQWLSVTNSFYFIFPSSFAKPEGKSLFTYSFNNN